MGADDRLVGRTEELVLLHRAVADRVGAMLRGVAGVGKTALVRAVLAESRREGEPTAWLAATKALAGVPLGAVAHLLPVGAIPSGGVDAPEWAFDEVVGGASADHPLVVAVDDVQLLDPASVAVVVRLIRSPRAVVFATTRTGEEDVPTIVAALAQRASLRRNSLPKSWPK